MTHVQQNINVQGVEKFIHHSLFHKRKAVSSDLRAIFCIEVNKLFYRPGQTFRQREVDAYRSYGKSTREDGNVVSLIV
jgi:hypothetical protein